MSTERDEGYLYFECDNCGETEGFEEADYTFQEAWHTLQSSGWFFLPSAREHECPDCRRERLAKLPQELSS